ncbi:MAG: DsbA family protein [Mailhella sp.]|nr:DsbA family protein [Mailhella sp.]
MPSFIYITDVFCPWCFGFAPVMQELAEEYRFPVRVLCGELVAEPTPTSKMGTPTLLAFFERLSSTTGREIGKGFFELLTPEKSVLMDSRRSAGLMAALKKLAPGNALEQMERFQDVFYVEGRDVLDPAVQADAASRWGVDAPALAGALASEGVLSKAEKELEEAEEILGDFVVYPSLFVKTDDGTLHAVARGYAPYAEVKAKIEKALACSGPDCEDAQSAVSAHACGLDGKGCC